MWSAQRSEGISPSGLAVRCSPCLHWLLGLQKAGSGTRTSLCLKIWVHQGLQATLQSTHPEITQNVQHACALGSYDGRHLCFSSGQGARLGRRGVLWEGVAWNRIMGPAPGPLLPGGPMSVLVSSSHRRPHFGVADPELRGMGEM